MTAPSLPEKVLAIHDRLGAADIAHAFGGALALAYYAEPRATIDIDVNVFTPAEEHPRVQRALSTLGVGDRVAAAVVARDGQVRLFWEHTPVDLFYAAIDLHDAMAKAVRRVAFSEGSIPILAPEHLATCKAVFDRPKDWLDLEQMLVATSDLRRDEVTMWLTEILGEDHPSLRRFEDLSRRFPRTT